MDASKLAIKRREQFESDCATYLKQLYCYVLSLVRNEADAAEITQETMLRFINLMNKRQWQEDVRNIPAYLFTIAKHLCFAWWRLPREEGQMDSDDEQREQVHKVMERKAMQDNNPTSRLEDDIYYKERYNALPWNMILGGLSADELRLLYMDAVEEMTTKEIAQELGKEVEVIQYQLNKLYAKIRWRARRLMQ